MEKLLLIWTVFLYKYVFVFITEFTLSKNLKLPQLQAAFVFSSLSTKPNCSLQTAETSKFFCPYRCTATSFQMWLINLFIGRTGHIYLRSFIPFVGWTLMVLFAADTAVAHTDANFSSVVHSRTSTSIRPSLSLLGSSAANIKSCKKKVICIGKNFNNVNILF